MRVNAARELHALLSEWQTMPNGKSIRQVRGAEWVSDSVRAVQLFAEVQGLIIDFERSEGRRPPVTSAMEALFNALSNVTTGLPWASGVSSTLKIVDDASLALLESFADLVDMAMRGIDFPEVTDDLKALRELVQDVERLIIDEYGDSVSVQERTYLLTLIRSLSDALGDIAAFGVVNVRNMIDQLIGALTKLAAADQDRGRAEKLRSFVGKVTEKASGAAVGAAVTHFAPFVLGPAEQALRAITTGG